MQREPIRPRESSAALSAAPADEELVRRVLRREESALGAIYDRYSRLVYTIALRITGDREAAEEVMQDVFQAVWQGVGSFQPGGSFAAWLTGIARHRAIDLTRSRRYRARARESALEEYAASDSAAADALVLRTVVQEALHELPPTQREAIELAYYGGLTHVEIAGRLGEPVGTVKSRMRLGLTRLRDLLRATPE
ncbi:MAG TPA: sigma-70 family RNA polymerase sigma factor [Roseiflexaceae bacterium]|nr:sigma-70 family RNA polymerase sigma factor [Roseiflexaceae bacterium]HEU5101664.1 sigma-70 family RNA polymerase sigma factor [Roseiflexaceae bacterium]